MTHQDEPATEADVYNMTRDLQAWADDAGIALTTPVVQGALLIITFMAALEGAPSLQMSHLMVALLEACGDLPRVEDQL